VDITKLCSGSIKTSHTHPHTHDMHARAHTYNLYDNAHLHESMTLKC